jgi:hypothetical protein
MSLLDPDPGYGWHDGRASWTDIQAALLLGVTAVLAAILLF